MDINGIIRETYDILGFEYPGENAPYEAPEITGRGQVAGFIDHTILKSDCDYAGVKKVCDEAKKYGFASVCVNPSYIAYAAKELEGTGVTPCSVICFPFGTQTPEAKAFEAADAVKNGAGEIDMVINVGALKNKEYDLCYRDIREVVKAIDGKAKLKVIIEACLLTDEEKVRICTIAKLAGADFVKTSTGYSKHGATVEDVALMRATVGPGMGVKAAGGIHNFDEAVAMIKAGADRLGCSAGVAIVSE
jgi:deoxyribose-phosphate aldolase